MSPTHGAIDSGRASKSSSSTAGIPCGSGLGSRHACCDDDFAGSDETTANFGPCFAFASAIISRICSGDNLATMNCAPNIHQRLDLLGCPGRGNFGIKILQPLAYGAQLVLAQL